MNKNVREAIRKETSGKPSGPTRLEQLITDRIHASGPISFRDFMDAALYHPDHGYFTSRCGNIGQGGDFCTSPELSNLFAELLARQLEEMWMITGEDEFNIIEFGAGNGTLCNGILAALRRNQRFYDGLHYSILEKNTSQEKQARKKIDDPDKVTWYQKIQDVKVRTGCVLSNEVVDNFPVHSVVMKDVLMEVFVDHSTQFNECLRPACPALIDHAERHQLMACRDTRFEINLDAGEWINNIAGILDKGFVITIDYGYSLRTRVTNTTGTVRCYKNQMVHLNPYIFVGEQDITCNVNFSALHSIGLDVGLNLAGYTNQASFLRSLGLVNYLRELEAKARSSSSKNTSVSHLFTLLNEMGDAFKVLIQSKNVPRAHLLGMSLSHPL